MVKNLPAMQETSVQSLGQEDTLEKGMATLSSILAWRNSCTKEPSGLQPMGLQRVRHNLVTNTLRLLGPQEFMYLPQTWWLKTTEMYYLTILEAKISKSRC